MEESAYESDRHAERATGAPLPRSVALQFAHLGRMLLGAAAFPLLLATGPVLAQQAGVVLLVNPSAVSRPEFAGLRQSMLNLAVEKRSIAGVTSVRSNEGLNNIIAREYGFGDTAEQRVAQRDIADAIKRLNGLTSDRIFVGQQLELPAFVRRPSTKGSNRSLAQVADYAGNSRSALLIRDPTGSALWNRDHLPADAATSQAEVSAAASREAGTSLVRMGLDDFFRNRAYIESLGNDIAFPPVGDDFVINLLQLSTPTDAPITLKNVTELERPIDPSWILNATRVPGKLYLLDFFAPKGSQQCEHGDLVRDKSEQILEAIGAGVLKDRIESINIDFFANRQGNLDLIRKWVDRFSGPLKEQYLEKLSALERRPAPPSTPGQAKLTVPGLFLQALYGTLLQRQDTLVISSSFSTISNDGVFPREFLFSGKSISLVSAVLNESADLEDDFYKNQEPLQTFRMSGDELGAVLVGFKDGNGQPKGMFSSSGVGVTTIDFGTVVGQSGGCKGKADLGASFAAPAVAAKLLVARLIWTAEGGSANAIVARRRLVMAGKVEESLLGRYRSASTPSIQRLLRPRGGHIYDSHGKERDVSSLVGTAYLTLKNPSAGPPLYVMFGRSPIPIANVFSAIQFAKDKAFVLDSRTLTWQVYSSSVIDALCLCDAKTSVQTIYSEAINNISEVMFYE